MKDEFLFQGSHLLEMIDIQEKKNYPTRNLQSIIIANIWTNNYTTKQNAAYIIKNTLNVLGERVNLEKEIITIEGVNGP